MLSLPSSRRSLAFAIIALLVIVGTAAPGYDAVAQRMDEGSLLLYPELILKGWLPYRDFETFYGPANAYLLAGVYAIFHPGILCRANRRARGITSCHSGRHFLHYPVARKSPSPSAPPWLRISFSCRPGWRHLPGSEGWPARSGRSSSWHVRPRRDRFFSPDFSAASPCWRFRPDLTPAVLLAAGLLLFFQPARMRWTCLLGLGLGLLPMLLLVYGAGFRNILIMSFSTR